MRRQDPDFQWHTPSCAWQSVALSYSEQLRGSGVGACVVGASDIGARVVVSTGQSPLSNSHASTLQAASQKLSPGQLGKHPGAHSSSGCGDGVGDGVGAGVGAGVESQSPPSLLQASTLHVASQIPSPIQFGGQPSLHGGAGVGFGEVVVG
jgi:hypothetical protein